MTKRLGTILSQIKKAMVMYKITEVAMKDYMLFNKMYYT